MNWEEVRNDPHLQNLPYKIELNADGKIIMSPVKVYHSILQGIIARLLNSQLAGGEAFPECAIATKLGTRVADFVWALQDKVKNYRTGNGMFGGSGTVCGDLVAG